MTVQTLTDVVTVKGSDIVPGDRLHTRHGFSAEITHFDTPPAGSFACEMFGGPGVRIPFHGEQPIMWPIAPAAKVDIKKRAA